MALPPLNLPVEIVLAPSLKVTQPEGVPELDAVTIAVKVTGWPATDGLTSDTMVVDVTYL